MGNRAKSEALSRHERVACGFGLGEGRVAFSHHASGGAWLELVSSDYCEEETRRNLPKLGRSAGVSWKNEIAPKVRFVRADVALDKPLVFPKAKDRPVVITALASRSTWLLTLDEGDFHTKLGREVYGLRIATPGEFLIEQRAKGVL